MLFIGALIIWKGSEPSPLKLKDSLQILPLKLKDHSDLSLKAKRPSGAFPLNLRVAICTFNAIMDMTWRLINLQQIIVSGKQSHNWVFELFYNEGVIIWSIKTVLRDSGHQILHF